MSPTTCRLITQRRPTKRKCILLAQTATQSSFEFRSGLPVFPPAFLSWSQTRRSWRRLKQEAGNLASSKKEAAEGAATAEAAAVHHDTIQLFGLAA